MRGALSLLLHSIRRVRVLVLALGVLLGAFQVLLTLVARSIQRSQSFENLSAMIPGFFRQLMGPSFIGLMSFAGIVCVGYFHIAVMGSLTGITIAVATEPASEIETGFMDLILSRPLARHWVITRSIVLALICIVFLVGMMVLGTWTGLFLLAPADAAWPSTQLINTLATNLGLLMLSWAGVTLAIAANTRRRSVAGATAGVLALGTYLLDYLGRAWEPAQSIAWLSPFRYYSALDLVMGSKIPALHLEVLVGVALAGVVAAYIGFSRRDI
jgi:ABC-2 type transport system permease protein